MSSNNGISKSARILSEFTMLSKISRDNAESLKFSIIDLKEDDYIINVNNKKISFRVLSDEDLSDFDKKVLQKDLRKKYSVFRSLRLIFTMQIVSPKLIVGCSSDRIFKTLISYKKDNIDYVVDYSNNVIMKQSDYYDFFSFEESNVLDKVDLYYIYIILEQTKQYEKIEYLLLFSDKVLKNMPRNGFTEEGVNNRNCLLFGNSCDSVFFSKFDSRKFGVRDELDQFTLNPNMANTNIYYDEEKNKYCYKNNEFGNFYFDLLSNYVKDNDTSSELLSERRYSYCHMNSQYIASLLGMNSKVVAGKISVGDNSYFLHSWVELDEVNVVADYNHNLIIDKDVYYKLYGAISINKTPINELLFYSREANNDAELGFECYMINYFGQEIHKDLSKNKQLFKK